MQNVKIIIFADKIPTVTKCLIRVVPTVVHSITKAIVSHTTPVVARTVTLSAAPVV